MTMIEFAAKVGATPPATSLGSSIGGDARVPRGLRVPPCRNCQSKLLLFLQIKTEKRFGLPFPSDSLLTVFMCPNCNEIPSFDQFPDGQLPPEYWSSHEGHWFAVLCQPSHDAIVIEQEPILLARSLVFDFVELEGPLDESVRIGGAPYWLQDPEVYRCCCGGEMTFVAQISENLPFPKQPAAPQQKDSFSADDYCLFLGNEVYIFACQRQCDPRAVWITVQG